MYWYNPTIGASEKVEAPATDEQAIQMLAGSRDSAEFIKEYCQLRRSGSPIEQALVLVGHEFRLRQPEVQLVLRYSTVHKGWPLMNDELSALDSHDSALALAESRWLTADGSFSDRFILFEKGSIIARSGWWRRPHPARGLQGGADAFELRFELV